MSCRAAPARVSPFLGKLTARERPETFGARYGTDPSRVDEILEPVGLADTAGTPAAKVFRRER
ncbi:hypothetical protein [Amycolatopsis cihanbeyliensis]|uniref:hypothetical protein n=1 Tax=Amycolatopsis cihanbeyliensis TaxID=1128664 RepID=UPI00115235CF|nr:hypothetical protein [Amycolatopsis cihanbeyliensis]